MSAPSPDSRAEALERSVQFYSALCMSPTQGNKPPSAATVLRTADAFAQYLATGKIVEIPSRDHR